MPHCERPAGEWLPRREERRLGSEPCSHLRCPVLPVGPHGLETLEVVVEAAWVAMTTLVMRETTVTIVLVDIGAVLMTLRSLVMMMVSGEAVLVPLEKAEAMEMVGAATVGVAVRVLTMGDRKEALRWQ